MHIIYLVLTMLLLEMQAKAMSINHRAPKRTGAMDSDQVPGQRIQMLDCGPSPDKSFVLLLYMSHIALLAVSFLRK